MQLLSYFSILALATGVISTPLEHYFQKRDGSYPTPLSPDEIAKRFHRGGFFLKNETIMPPTPHNGTVQALKIIANETVPAKHNSTDAFLPFDMNVTFKPQNQSAIRSNGTKFTEPKPNNPFFNHIYERDCADGLYCCPDPRVLYEDTNWPWSTIGKTLTPVGDGLYKSCTATLIGPRHILTASHCMNCQSSTYLLSFIFNKGN